jgi:hypothetical protein
MSDQPHILDGSCEDCSQLLPELALGSLDGRERAVALGHIRSCPHCRRELGAYQTLADDLLDLVPAAAPPAGFEVRALAAMKATRPGIIKARPRPRWGRLLATAAAVVALIGATLFGGYQLGRPSAPIPPLHTAAITASGRQIGAAYFYTGSQEWVWVAVWAAGNHVKQVTCELRPGPGRKPVIIGTFPLSSGQGAWGSPLSVRFSTATLILSSGGQTIATATVRT